MIQTTKGMTMDLTEMTINLIDCPQKKQEDGFFIRRPVFLSYFLMMMPAASASRFRTAL